MMILALGGWLLWSGGAYASGAMEGVGPVGPSAAQASETLLSLEALQRSLAMMELEAG
jgi:hypothetical protein